MEKRKKKPPVVEAKVPRRVPGEKRRLNFKLDGEIADWAFEYAEKHNTTVTQLITDYFLDLQRREIARQAQDAEQI